MNIKLRFLGAAHNVTGSSYLLEANGNRILIDCGIFQERQLSTRNWEPFPVPPKTINSIFLTHGHLDHCGILPKLTREGFTGNVYCSPATAEIAKIVILDSAKIQEEDAAFKKRRHEETGKPGKFPEVPLYTVKEAEEAVTHIKAVSPEKSTEVRPGIQVSFHEAGHIIGSSSIMVRVSQGNQERTIVFSGDIGRWNAPIIRDPAPFKVADYVIMESTYGDKDHEPEGSIPGKLAAVINETKSAGGNLVIPVFAVERTQEILYHLSGLLAKNLIPHLAVFVDSPMAVKVTEVFSHHPELYDDETRTLLRGGNKPCDFPGLVMCRTVDESKAINHIKGTVIIMAGSGMCNAGRIKHHLVANISRPESTILFVGYQAFGTLGRLILDGAKQVRILGQTHLVNARVARIEGFSAHAGKDELIRWVTSLEKAPRRVFVTHGEPEVSQSFATALAAKTGWPVSVPAYREEVILN